MSQNPFLSASQERFSAFPFQLLQKSHYLEALRLALEEGREKLEVIKTNRDPANFENSIYALETAGEKLNRVATVFFNLLGAESDDELQAMAKEISPAIAAFSSDVSLDPKLFERVQKVWQAREQLGLNAEQKMLVEKTYKDFVRNGATLDAEKKSRLRSIDQELARLTVEFSDNVLKYTNDFQMWLDKSEDLAGLPESAVEAAKQAASEAGQPTRWLITLQGPSYIAFMTHSDRADLREKLWRAYNSRAGQAPYDNAPLAKQIVQRRGERAQLLGYKSHADFVLADRMAESPQRVTEFLNRLITKAKPAGERDVKAVAQLKSGAPLMPWDYAYYSEKLKKRDYDFDEEELRPYFKLEDVIAGAFEHASRLFGLEFKIQPGIPVYHPDVTVYEVIDRKDKRHIGLFYADFFPRKGKRSGAWMTSFREQGLHGGELVRPHVSIVCNFTKPTQNKPSLLTFSEVQTLFHEFGHALHGLLSEVTYTSLSGTNVYWDFVELPSQFLENWTLEKEALDLFARHYQTGEPIPKELTDKIKRAAKFQAGYQNLRQLSFSILDLAWHSDAGLAVDDLEAFETKVTESTTLLPRVPGCNFSTSFLHIFAGGYSAGYYSYKWAEVLDADAFEMFKEKGLFDQDSARRFREFILSKGGTEHPMELYKKFRGREPDPDALLRRDGLL